MAEGIPLALLISDEKLIEIANTDPFKAEIIWEERKIHQLVAEMEMKSKIKNKRR